MLKGLGVATVLMALVSLVAAACGGGEEPAPDPTVAPTVAPAATVAATAAPAPTVAATRAPTVAPTVAPAPTAPPPTVAPSGASPGAVGTPVTSVNQDPGGSGSYTFNPSDFTFKVGDVVTFTLVAETEFHTFTVDDLGIDVVLDPGSSVPFTYTFNAPGTFKLICIPHEFQGMVGTITVTP